MLNGETRAIRPNASPATTASIRVAPSRSPAPGQDPGPSATSSTCASGVRTDSRQKCCSFPTPAYGCDES
jgi:hypothetical protein